VAGLAAVAAAVLVRRFAASNRWVTSLGLLAMVAGLSSVRFLTPSPEGLVLVVPFTLLAVGASVALTAAIGQAEVGAAMFGLALCLPAVLAGYLLGTGVQLTMLRGVSSAQELVDGFVSALHLWALVGGFLMVMVIVMAAVLSRRARATEEEADNAQGDDVRESSAVSSVPAPAQSPEDGAPA
jgi:multisubunit Na+/H+ antiporter MnhC subunit